MLRPSQTKGSNLMLTARQLALTIEALEESRLTDKKRLAEALRVHGEFPSEALNIYTASLEEKIREIEQIEKALGIIHGQEILKGIKKP